MRLPVAAQGRLRAAAFLASFDRFTIPPLLVPIHEDLGVSLGATAAVASAYFITFGACQPLWGGLSDRFGRVPVLRGAVAGGGLVCVAAAFAPSLGLLVAARALAGLFFAANMPTSMTYVGDTVPLLERQPALARLMAFGTAGVASGTIVAGVLAQFVGWRPAFLVSAAVAVGVSVMLVALPEPPREHPAAPFVRQVRTIARHRWVLAVVGLALVEGAVIFGSLTFVSAALQKNGVGAALAGSAVAGFGIANTSVTPLVTRAIRRRSGPVLIAFGAGLAGLGLALCGFDTTVLTAIVATVALGVGFGFLHSNFQLWATEVLPQARAVTISFFAGAIYLGGALATLAAAPLLDAGRFSALFLVAAAGAGAIALVGPLLRARYLAQVARRGDSGGADAAPARG